MDKEVSLVKRDLSVGHSEFEGLRRKEREGLSPFIFPRVGPLAHKDSGPRAGGLNASPAGGSALIGKSLSHLWEPERGFLVSKRKAFPSPAMARAGQSHFLGGVPQLLQGRVVLLPSGA